MYSPKIQNDLIPLLYQIKQAQNGKPMTEIVDDILRPVVFELHEKLVEYEQGKQGGEKDGKRPTQQCTAQSLS